MASQDFTYYGTLFTPKESKNITHGKTSLQAYPPLGLEMSPAGKSYGYLFTKSALGSADLAICTKLQAFGDLTNTTPLVSAIAGKFILVANEFIKNHGKLNIKSYDSANGCIINNSTVAG